MQKLLIVLTAALALIATQAPAKPGNSQLPPGLAKKAAKGQELPPGWKKKLAKGTTLDPLVFAAAVEVSQPDSKGLISVKVEDKVLRLVKETREIIDILR
ncbi:MAG: hypothetical protein OEZ68_05440 [Gammaproteobacteria bacterium]|nr:hypothetical protein [Gammaproteobacteria bacterium]MDH5800232.1 hypothetical protein [Gammaproteobacteria bacterium]